MSENNPYLNNPLHGVGLETVLKELVDHYGFEVLYAYSNINCFKIKPSIATSVKFLKKTEWARKKIEILYLYQYKNLPSVSADQFDLPPRERIIPEHQTPREPAVLTVEDGIRLQEERAKNFEQKRNARNNSRHGSGSSRAFKERNDASQKTSTSSVDPWSKSKKKSSKYNQS